MKKKIQAFTLIELTVSMLLCSLLAGAVLMLYEQAGRSYGRIKVNSEASSLRQQLQSLMVNDCSKAAGVTMSEDRLIINRTDKNRITYYLPGRYVIRETLSARDTFFTGNYNVWPEQSLEVPGLTGKISLEYLDGESKIVVTVTYSNQVKFNNDQN